MKLLLTSLSLLFIISCASKSEIKSTSPKKTSTADKQTTSSSQSLYDKALNLKNNRQFKSAVNTFEQIVSENKESAIAGESIYQIAEIYLDLGKYESAIEQYQRIVKSDIDYPSYLAANISIAKIYFKLNQYAKSVAYLDNVIASRDSSKAEYAEALQMRAYYYEMESQWLSSLKLLIASYNSNIPSDLKESIRQKSSDIVDSKLSTAELQQIIGDSDFSFLRANAYFRLGVSAFEDSNFRKAESYFENAQSDTNNSWTAERAQQYLVQIQALNKVDPYTIGVVLPFSGKLSKIANRSLNAIQMALGTYDSSSPFKIAIIDSEDKPELARRAVEKLVIEDNVIAIIGDILNKSGTAVAQKAQELGIPTISLVQKSGISDTGDYIFRNSLTNQMQVHTLVDTAMRNLNYKKFAIVYPNDTYGVEFANLFWDEVLARGGQITAVQVYDPKETDFKDVVKRLVGSFYVEDRADEYALNLKQWREKNKNSRKEPTELLSPIVDFDAIFIPDSLKAMGQISAMLNYNDVAKTSLLGTNLWNTNNITKRLSNNIERVVFVDLKQNQESQNYKNFEQKFQSLFNEQADNFSIQAYDSANILKQLILGGAKNRTTLKEQLSDLKGFPGVGAELNMSKNREILQPTQALSVKDNQIQAF